MNQDPKSRRVTTDTTILILFLGVAALALGLSTLTMPSSKRTQESAANTDAPPSYQEALHEAELQEARAKAQHVQEDLASKPSATGAVPAPEPESKPLRVAKIEPDSGVGHFRVEPVKVLGEVKPSYPMAARSARVQGDVDVRLMVDRRGTPTRATVLSGPTLLRHDALLAAQAWRFSPERRNGTPVAAPYNIHFNFRLA